MKAAIDNKGPRIVIYSAHDSNIISFNAALNFTNLNCLMAYFYDNADNEDTCIVKFPSFAANMILELWEEDNLSYSVKVVCILYRFYTMEYKERYLFAIIS